MIKIAYILTPVEFGGSEKVNLTFLRNVDKKQYNLHPILLVRPWEEDNLFINKIEKADYYIQRIPVALKPRSEGRDYFRLVRCILYLYRVLKGNRFDVVHTHGYFADIIGVPVSRLLRIPHLSTCHGFISNDRNLKIYNSLDRFSLRFCNRIIAVSEGIKDDLIKNGISGSKIVVIQNAVQNSYNPDSFEESKQERRKILGIKENEYVAGYIGRLSDEKGLEYLIEAGPILREKDEAIKILIIGDGPKRKELENLTKKKGLEREIFFTGFQNNIEEWMPVLDIFVLPSLTEGTPMALLEAMSAGIPPIASAVGGVPKVVEDGINGFLVPPGDFQAISAKVIALKKNPELQKKIASEAVNLIKNRFGVHEWCRKIEAQYNELLAKS
jgi:glycosyltransferase involved in cell wall biosynthesis